MGQGDQTFSQALCVLFSMFIGFKYVFEYIKEIAMTLVDKHSQYMYVVVTIY